MRHERSARRVLVTGGAGFIGSHLVDTLVARGDAVTVLDDLSTGEEARLARALTGRTRLVVADVRDADAVRAAVREARPQVVFHLAARVDVRTSVADPIGDASVNLLGTIAVLQAAAECGVDRVVHSSTGGALYGEAGRRPTTEDAEIRPLSPYGLGKWAAERYCAWFTDLHGLPVVTLRYANVYGPGQGTRGEGGVVGVFCSRALAGERPVVFGDGRQTRDFVHVEDVVTANLLAAVVPGAHGAYNVGSGVETSVLELIATVADAAAGFGVDPESFRPVLAPDRPGEVRHSALDPGRAARELGLSVRTTLARGVRSTLAALAQPTPPAALRSARPVALVAG